MLKAVIMVRLSFDKNYYNGYLYVGKTLTTVVFINFGILR